VPNRQRWADPSSYKPEWGERAKLAALLVPDAAAVLEIGVGTGVFRDLVKGRTEYVGADLQPLDTTLITLDLDRDPLPSRHFDYAVLLGVFDYLDRPQAAAKKLCDAADHVIVSYCCRRTELPLQTILECRARRGWVNSFNLAEFSELFCQHGHDLILSTLFNEAEDFEQYLMTFRRSDVVTGP
jgi:hypothetical protein